MNNSIIKILWLLVVCITQHTMAQQDPQFTQYMYNTMGINPAYSGSRGHLTFTGIHRSQWIAIEGAPKTQTFGLDTPIGKNTGMGVSIINDKIGPSDEFYMDLNFSYTVKVSDRYKLSFGLKAGGRFLNLDWTKGQTQSPDQAFNQNINNRLLPTVGAGIYLHGEKHYIGLSVPNFFQDQHYDDIQQLVASERMHFFLIGGLVFDLSKAIKFKPACLIKSVKGAPLSTDVSANFMFDEKLTLGVSYRWEDAVSALVGFRITPGLTVGYSYDYTTSKIQKFTTGSHEILLRYELTSKTKQLKSPRFF